MPQLLTQNTKLRKTSKAIGLKVMNFGIPAYEDSEGRRTCPFAGSCASFCYAQKGAYSWSNVKPAFKWRYEQTKSDGFVDAMVSEIVRKKADMIRVHDSGDYYSPKYINKWMAIAEALPHVRFYSYTKSVPLFLDRVWPDNFDIIFSEGGTKDHLIDRTKHRHCRIFDSYEAMAQADYVNAMDSDVMATKWFNQSSKVGLVFH